MRTPLLIAQLTDVHLGPVTGFTPRYWSAKRLAGYVNWARTRRDAHDRHVLDALVRDMHLQAPDHVLVTGDLANIGLPHEHIHALAWLRSIGAPDTVSVIPGNHDIYGRLRRDPGTSRWNAYMASDAAGSVWTGDSQGFPYVRMLGPVALIGVNSAVTTPPLIAWGRVGKIQLERLAALLDALGEAEMFRLIMIHHPPLPGQADTARGLRDAAALEALLMRHGAELVIHGHNHQNSLEWRQTPAGALPIVGAPSASLGLSHKNEPLARYNLYRIEGPPWRIEMTGRGLVDPGGPIRELERRLLSMHDPAA
jgi:3',5'-cyclic AMP phosphodiesterase CpdA